ncbi:Major facilitator superfamily domain, general substrate transporter [Penicillium expansum]|uniref:MFS-type transporter cnsO n=1 Tax=Penicillium expansum TaxID=27334 RepID=CNSO_PENEN|nr:Major facilitator superfamily domain, general substrate transporter [Penicillium expansum]A0A0A2IBP6.1 RecName: Full=MFS-type transporter cnsO; AltName: Full=Communesin biosynthesis cluster protein O [Penicillium expansum]KGO40484.1 Major facilitator superfamily domain, general substrate transporter [Penicillium expansum]KGO59708.1 Major facilitator superfamily domain, general substrate transporter [Penicillium expansum]
MESTDSSPPLSMTDTEKKGDAVTTVTDESSVSEYERFLHLENVFSGASRKKLLRKLDLRLLPTLSFLYLMCSLDKSNAGNAKLFGLLEDLGMSGTQYNLALMYFFFTYGLSEPVSNIMLRRVGPKIWFPFIVCAWGLITTLTSQASSYAGFVVIRLMLGITEAGLYPGAYFILSMWYTPKEIGTRMAIFYGANTTAGAFGGVIAYGVGSLDGNLGWRAWRWLFLIEGCITIFAGLACLFCLPAFPHQYQAGKGTKWLTDEELEYASLRVKYANGPVSSTYTFRWSDVVAAAKDRKTYFMMMLFWWGGSVPTYSLSYTLPTMVANLGYTAVKAQVMTTPPYIFATCVCVAVGYISDQTQRRYLCIMGAYTLGLIGIIILWITVHHPSIPGVSYFAIFLAAAGYSAQAPIVGAWTASNITNPSKRAAAIGLLMLLGSVGGGSIGSNIYISSEAPTYPLGFGFSVGATVLGAMIPATIHWFLMRKENKRRGGLDVAEIERKYTTEELGEMGEDSPLFRFVL